MYDSSPPRHSATMPSAIQRGLRRPAIRGGSGSRLSASVRRCSATAVVSSVARRRRRGIPRRSAVLILVSMLICGCLSEDGGSAVVAGGDDVGVGTAGAGDVVDAD